MLIQTRTMVVKKGFADQVIERFTQDSPMDAMEGLIDKTVMVNRKKQEDDVEEVVVVIRWRSIEDWKNWEKSDAHIQGHREKRGKPQPEYLVSVNVNMYDVKAVKEGQHKDQA
ncbi:MULTISPECIES: antibiotic biosynthesis monooxygenase [Paenibacillus]|uniref:Antibiotic biosynthesis monooxygenase n=1 Tax=Paenibacillus campinasensis TaxID=66347 RepID=A0A268EN16_9BACL|nr:MULTISPECIES: antibiotic biosynthesis monooxygenase [Paenibacillus]MUG65794.1 antibiotic biosynthesis monooxygenase [Paenibacillus campinasensis]PAD74510.1 antibiotic biosynthesis monooxygenase [Paenibacillus campinasensis]PAK51596.1 antibiotic biosynthesis monooxygenase [Paenibacillus sp. 7541]